LLGKSKNWDTWVFDTKPFGRIENSQQCSVVVFETGTWSSPNEHNTARFPILTVDIWADPSRGPGGDVLRYDADTKIEAVHDVVKQAFHLMQNSSKGSTRTWGTAGQEAEKSGVPIFSSKFLSGPDYSDIEDTSGGRMSRYTYAIETI
jgi:hypothetical protein